MDTVDIVFEFDTAPLYVLFYRTVVDACLHEYSEYDYLVVGNEYIDDNRIFVCI